MCKTCVHLQAHLCQHAANSCQCVHSAFLHSGPAGTYVSACQSAHKSFPDWCDRDNHIQRAQNGWEQRAPPMAGKRWAVASGKKKKKITKLDIILGAGPRRDFQSLRIFWEAQQTNRSWNVTAKPAWQTDAHKETHSAREAPCKQVADHPPPAAAAVVVKQTKYLLEANDPSQLALTT